MAPPSFKDGNNVKALMFPNYLSLLEKKTKPTNKQKNFTKSPQVVEMGTLYISSSHLPTVSGTLTVRHLATQRWVSLVIYAKVFLCDYLKEGAIKRIMLFP